MELFLSVFLALVAYRFVSIPVQNLSSFIWGNPNSVGKTNPNGSRSAHGAAQASTVSNQQSTALPLLGYAKEVHFQVNEVYYEILLSSLEKTVIEHGFHFTTGTESVRIPEPIKEHAARQMMIARHRHLSPRMNSKRIDEIVDYELDDGFGQAYTEALIVALARQGIVLQALPNKIQN